MEVNSNCYDMEVEKWVVNNHYYTKQGDEFIYLGRKKREKNVYHLLHFVANDSYQYVCGSLLNNPARLKDYSKPHVVGVGYSKGTKDAPFFPSLHPSAYELWSAMLSRCYLGGSGTRSYKDVEVAEEWHDFSNFLAWYKNEVYDDSAIHRYKLTLDKDLFGGDRRVYSPETCCFLPKSLNSLIVGLNFNDFTKDTAKRIYHIQTQLEAFNGIISPRVKSYFSHIIEEYERTYYKLVGFTLKQLFEDEFRPQVNLKAILVSGYLEYDSKVYKFHNLEELKTFVCTVECEEKADRVERLLKKNILSPGKPRKLVEVKG